MSNASVDFQNETFKTKIEDYLNKLEKDLNNAKEELDFHNLILKTFNTYNVTHTCLQTLEESILETEKFIKVIETKKSQGKKLQEFLEGEFVLDFDKFTFLIIDVTGSQMVNYVELKNEFLEVSKKWTKTSRTTKNKKYI